MARFFFDLHDGADIYLDLEGGELPSLVAAKQEAFSVLLDSMRTRSFDAAVETGAMNVRDDTGRVVLIANLSAVCHSL